MHAISSLPTYQIVAIAVAIVVIMLFLFPASRRLMVNLWMQFSGWLDARLLHKHHHDLVVRAVTRRIARITRHTEGTFAQWLRKCRSWFGWLGTAYHRALTEWQNAAARLADESAKAASPHDVVPPEMPQFMPLGPTSYWLAQLALGLGECALTYTAFQTWHLAPALLIVVVVGSGLLGGALGHLCGQAIYRRSTRGTVLIGLACAVYCLVLGVMRFAWLTRDDEAGGASFANFLGAFGWPLLCVAASIIVGSQLRYRSALEQAQLDEARMKHRCEALNERGKAVQKALRDRMRARVALKTTAIDAFHRGFTFGWTSDPIAFPDQQIVIPESEIDALWPPVRWSPETAAQASSPSANGSPVGEFAV